MTEESPFIQGMAAYRNGQPETDNPYRKGENVTPDNYPGSYANWAQGWRVAKWQKEHDRRAK